MRLLRLFRDPHVGKHFKIFLVACVLWFLLSGVNIRGWMTYKISFFGLTIHTFSVTDDIIDIPYSLGISLRISIMLLGVIAIASLILIISRYAIPDIKKKWEST